VYIPPRDGPQKPKHVAVGNRNENKKIKAIRNIAAIDGNSPEGYINGRNPQK
jgi:hypothetical protein